VLSQQSHPESFKTLHLSPYTDAMAAEAGLAAAAQQTQQQTQQRETKRTANFQVELQAIEDYRRFAALTIQRYVRGWLVRLRRARRVSARVLAAVGNMQGSLDTSRQPLQSIPNAH
jgi:hypothetical protein